MIPTLALTHRARFQGRLDDDRADYIRTAIQEHIEELADLPSEKPSVAEAIKRAIHLSPKTISQVVAKNGHSDSETAEHHPPVPSIHMEGAENVRILCLPARDEADDLAGAMFAQVLERQGFKAEAISVTKLVSEMVDLVGKKKADIVIISALPPSAIGHARYLCKRLHQKYPDLNLMIGLWTSTTDLAQIRDKVSCTERDVLVNNFADGLKQFEQLAHPLILNKTEPTDATQPRAPESVASPKS